MSCLFLLELQIHVLFHFFLLFRSQEMRSLLSCIAYIVVRIIGPKNLLVNLLPIDEAESKIAPCSIHNPKVSALPAKSHLARESLVFIRSLIPSPVPSAWRKTSSRLSYCIPHSSRPLVQYSDFSRNRHQGETRPNSAGAVQNAQSTTPTTFSFLSTKIFCDRRSPHQTGNGPFSWDIRFSLSSWSRTSPRDMNLARNLRRQSSADSITSFLWYLICEICSSARTSKYETFYRRPWSGFSIEVALLTVQFRSWTWIVADMPLPTPTLICRSVSKN